MRGGGVEGAEWRQQFRNLQGDASADGEQGTNRRKDQFLGEEDVLRLVGSQLAESTIDVK